MNNRFALVLTGGGARGAYQAGVLKALGEILKKYKKENPLKILTGTSAGAINTIGFAHFTAQNLDPYEQLAIMWSGLRNEEIYKTSTWSFIQNSYRWTRSLSMKGRGTDYRLLSLFDACPLREFLKSRVDFEAIHKSIENKTLDALTVSAMSYSTGVSKIFYETNKDVKPWVREKRIGIKEKIELEHILASSAIPILFPPIKVGNEYYGDGGLRDYTPLSPAIKMGANKLFVIGVRKKEQPNFEGNDHIPTPGKILSMILNGILLDAIDQDTERLMRINELVNANKELGNDNLKSVDLLYITPSQPLSEIAEEETAALKGTLRYLVRGLGNLKDSADLISYILFESSYTTKLVELGYNDGLREEEKIREFFYIS